MLNVVDSLWVHWRQEAISCCLCTQTYDERYVAVILRTGGTVLGHLCPNCLSTPPRFLATQLDGLASQLAERALEVSAQNSQTNGTSSNNRGGADERRLRGTTAQLQREMRDFSPVIRALAILHRLDYMRPGMNVVQQANIAASAIEEAGRLKSLTKGLGRLRQWNVPLSELIAREILTSWLACPETPQSVIREGVLARYQHLTAQTEPAVAAAVEA